MTAIAGKKFVKADATKDFFVTMLTRDISLRDCIFDLLDNAIDGARRNPRGDEKSSFTGYSVDVEFDAQYFRIIDNCGGISLADALDYAFNFGKKNGARNDVSGGIGLYGIGMKRAIFKIGRHCEVLSHADDASFTVLIDVDNWRKDDTSWDFEYFDSLPSANKGTTLSIREIPDSVGTLLADPAFTNELIKNIARDYAFFIQQGLVIKIGAELVPSYSYRLMESAQMAPLVEEYLDDGVSIRILAGIVDELPDDIPEELKPTKVERSGWFVICNDRVVLAADKSEKTVWGDGRFNVWHPQYNFMAGFVFFYSDDQRKLPWTTTKRDLDASSPLYRRAVERMKQATEPFIKYSNERKADIETAKKVEIRERFVDVTELQEVRAVRLPTVSTTSTRSEFVTISYRRSKKDLDEVKTELGNRWMSNRDAGERTFEYFRKMELGK